MLGALLGAIASSIIGAGLNAMGGEDEEERQPFQMPNSSIPNVPTVQTPQVQPIGQSKLDFSYSGGEPGAPSPSPSPSPADMAGGAASGALSGIGKGVGGSLAGIATNVLSGVIGNAMKKTPEQPKTPFQMPDSRSPWMDQLISQYLTRR
jgi:hypothetical protein